MALAAVRRRAAPSLRGRVLAAEPPSARRDGREPGVPAEAERAVDQGLVAADRGVGADLEVGPAQLVLDLLVALLDPVPDAVDPGDLGQVSRPGAGCRPRAGRRAGAGWWPGTRWPWPAGCPGLRWPPPGG